ncbi:MAG: prepilin peptidase [Solirubrobacterales bacterium]
MLVDKILLIVMIICFVTDVMKQKIYNVVIFPALIAAFILNIYIYGLPGLKLSLLGFAVGFAILIVPYLLGGIGAGDVKLLALVGALKGSMFVLNTSVYMALIGGAIALIIMVFNKDAFIFIKKIFSWITSFFVGVRYKLELQDGSLSKKFPYGIAIVIGSLICLFFKEAWVI